MRPEFAIATACLASWLAAQTGPAPSLERFELGDERALSGVVLKETVDAVFVDLGFDVVRVPRSAILRREPIGEPVETGEAHDAGIFFTQAGRELPVADAARKVGGAVVRIESPGGQGSGFLTSKDGHIVTNFHVVEDELRVDVVIYVRDGDALRTRTIRGVAVLAANPDIDLALVKIDPPEDLELTPVPLGDSDHVKVGAEVFAIGAPIGLDRTVSSGIVSVTDRAFAGHTMLQITVPINPGNSGGPLFNLRGEVVGVNSAGYMGMQGLNFAIPSRYVRDFLANRSAFAIDDTRTEHGVHFLPAPRRPRN